MRREDLPRQLAAERRQWWPDGQAAVPAITPPMRQNGFVPSGGVIGDGQSAAQVAADGAIDWWAAPAMDAPPVFAAMLGPECGGAFTLAPAVPYQAEQQYLPETSVRSCGCRCTGARY